jgi:hypothetical protein
LAYIWAIFHQTLSVILIFFKWLNAAEMAIVNGTSNDSGKSDKPNNDPVTKYDVDNSV